MKMKPPCRGCGGRNVARSRRRTVLGISSFQLGVDNEKLHQRYKVDSGEAVTDVQRTVQHPASPCMATTLDAANTFVSPVRAAHAEFVAALLGNSPRPISVDVDAVDLEDRADHLNKVLKALSVYVAAILDDTAQNVPGGLNLRQIDALLSDLTSDVTGTIQRAADATARRVA